MRKSWQRATGAQKGKKKKTISCPSPPFVFLMYAHFFSSFLLGQRCCCVSFVFLPEKCDRLLLRYARAAGGTGEGCVCVMFRVGRDPYVARFLVSRLPPIATMGL